MSRFTVSNLPLSGIKCITRQQIGDHRGFFSRLYCAEELGMAGWNKPIVQINHTFTARSGTVRGLHYQVQPHTEMKLISCIRGEIWDIAVDLRTDSPTFLQWHAEHLSSTNGKAMLLSEGFAHGFQALTDDCELLYLHTAAYTPQAEAGLRYNDPHIGIAWPLQITEISKRDDHHPFLTKEFKGLHIV
jgi:dTDP-4-dehydrorhamnose 3,5-epimerase